MLLKQLSNCFTKRNLRILNNHRFYSETISENHYDIIIVGGGLIGSTLTCALGKNKKLADKRILLLEHTPQKQYDVFEHFNNRVLALNPSTCKLLKDINVWDHIPRSCEVKHMQVWDSLTDAVITFDSDKDEKLAHIVENDFILKGAFEELKNLKNVSILYQSKIQQLDINNFPLSTKVVLGDGSQYTCNLLVGCDGFNSQVRKLKNVHYISRSYNQSCVVATLNIQQDGEENSTAWQRFLPDSEVIALLPLNSEYSSLVWTMNNKNLKSIMALNEEDFRHKLEEQIHKTFETSQFIQQCTRSFDNLIRSLNYPSTNSKQIAPKIKRVAEGSRACFPIGIGHASNYVGTGFVLVGDAAHRVHPLAGQGVNLGFGDVSVLNKVLSDAAMNGAQLSDFLYLKTYEQERQSHNTSILLAVHGLWTLYGLDNSAIVLARSLGLQATHALTPLKKLIMSHASA